MIEHEELVELDGPFGRCSSTAAIDVARRLATRRDSGARMHKVSATEGLGGDGSSTRWEVVFDLPTRVAGLVVVVTFTYDESARSFGSGVAAILETAFPAPGSELERMAVSKGMSRRRIRGIWRQTMAGHRRLPDVLPDAADILAALGEQGHVVGELRSLDASVSRSGNPRWIATDRHGRHEVRWTVLPDGRFSYSV